MTSVPKVYPPCDTWSPTATPLPFIIYMQGGGVIPHYQRINLNYTQLQIPFALCLTLHTPKVSQPLALSKSPISSLPTALSYIFPTPPPGNSLLCGGPQRGVPTLGCDTVGVTQVFPPSWCDAVGVPTALGCDTGMPPTLGV